MSSAGDQAANEHCASKRGAAGGRAWCSSYGLLLLVHGQARPAEIITEVVLAVEQSHGQK